MAPKSALISPRYVKRRYTEELSRDHPKLISAPGELTRSSDAAPPVGPQDQQPSLESATLTRTFTRGRHAGNSPPKDHVISPVAWKIRGYVTMPNTPSVPPSEVDQIDNARMENPSPSELAILSPHAIPTDLTDLHATWNRLPLMEDRNSDYGFEQALKPRRSIADKLSSMVERGWVGGDTCCKDDNEFASHITRSRLHIGEARRDRTSHSWSETSRPMKLPTYSGSLSVSNAELRSESQRSSGQDLPTFVKQKRPLILLNRKSNMRMHRQAKPSSPVDTTPRSNSDPGVHHLKTECANPIGKRRVLTLHHFGRSTSNHSQIQQEASHTVWPHFARPNRHSSEPDPELPKLTPPHEGPIAKPGFEPTALRDEQLHRNPEPRPNWMGSRRSSSNAKESTRNSSRSTSFFKKFPWYMVALVDKQPLVQDLLNEGQGIDGTSKSTRASQQDPTADQVGLSRGISKSRTLAGCEHEVDENTLKTKTLPGQGTMNQQAMNARSSRYTVSGQSSLQLTTSPQDMNERPPFEQIQRALESLQEPHVTNFKTTPEGLLGNSHQVVEDVTEQTQSPTGMGLSGTRLRVRSQPGSMDASFAAAISGESLRSFQARVGEMEEHSSMQPHAPSSADSTRQRADRRLERDSFGSAHVRAGEGFTANSDPCQQLRSEVVTLSPTRLETWTDSLPASVHRSNQDGPVHREVKGRGKGIKKIQVTITFDGAGDLVMEAQLQNENRQEHWRTTI